MTTQRKLRNTVRSIRRQAKLLEESPLEDAAPDPNEAIPGAWWAALDRLYLRCLTPEERLREKA